VHNAVHANLLAARHEQPDRRDVFNVACGQRVTLNELAAVMRNALHRPDLTPVYQDERAGDVRHSLADLTHVQRNTGYEPSSRSKPAARDHGLVCTILESFANRRATPTKLPLQRVTSPPHSGTFQQTASLLRVARRSYPQRGTWPSIVRVMLRRRSRRTSHSRTSNESRGRQ
jgi:hypothetical protein